MGFQTLLEIGPADTNVGNRQHQQRQRDACEKSQKVLDVSIFLCLRRIEDAHNLVNKVCTACSCANEEYQHKRLGFMSNLHKRDPSDDHAQRGADDGSTYRIYCEDQK